MTITLISIRKGLEPRASGAFCTATVELSNVRNQTCSSCFWFRSLDSIKLPSISCDSPFIALDCQFPYRQRTLLYFCDKLDFSSVCLCEKSSYVCVKKNGEFQQLFIVNVWVHGKKLAKTMAKIIRKTYFL
ncbi:hypothetical protein C0J52_25507, partial [Blattella germanica]